MSSSWMTQGISKFVAWRGHLATSPNCIAKVLACNNPPPPRFSHFEFEFMMMGKKTPPDVEIRMGDLLDYSSLESAVRGVDVVVHLAAVMDFYPKDVAAMYQTNVEGTSNLARAFAKELQRRFPHGTPTESSAHRFIYISTTESKYSPSVTDTHTTAERREGREYICWL